MAGACTDIVFAVGDLTVLALFFAGPLKRRLNKAQHTFPLLRFTGAAYFATAAISRFNDLLAGAHTSPLRLGIRFVHSVAVFYLVAAFWTRRERLVTFLEAVADAEGGQGEN